MLIDQTHQNFIKNQTNDVTSHIHWISGHANIPNNEKTNQLIKLTLNINVISLNRFLFFDFIKNQIIKFNQNEWKLLWIQNPKKGKRYQKFDTQPGDSKVKYLNNQEKLITATIMQLKFGHDYFNSYLKNLINHSKISKCYERCYEMQNPDHLLINCSYFRNQQTALIKNIKSHTQLIKALCIITKKLEHLINFWN